MYAPSHVPSLHATLRKNASGAHCASILSALKPPKRASNSSVSSEEGGPGIIGGILNGGQVSWLARGSVFVTISTGNNSSNSVFDFNQCYPGFHFVVTSCCLCEKLLMIGLKGVDGRGCVAIYNPLISKLVKAIDIPYPVTALEMISSHGGPTSSSRVLSKSLHWLFGIIAVGTEEGHLYLLDLRFDGSEASLDPSPSQVEIVPTALRDVPSTREAIIDSNGHMAFEPQAACHEEGVFHFALPDDEILESFYPSDAAISSLLYEPRVASLFVGFAFGQFQIFCLRTLSLLYSSELPETVAPILEFSFQEPENDPRNFCYLWVARGSKVTNDSQSEKLSPLVLYMFQLAFLKKELLPRLPTENASLSQTKSQVLYKNFEICGLRFEHPLGNGMLSNFSMCRGSSLLLCSSAEKYIPDSEHGKDGEEQFDGDDYSLSPSSSLCIFGWLGPRYGKHKDRGSLNLLVFDINRWYMAHMPSNLRGDDDDFIYSAYWTFDYGREVNEEERLLGMGVPPDSIRHFSSGMKPYPERYLLPSACSFTCHLITDQSGYQYSLLGHQQQVLNAATELKSSCLVNPKEMHSNMLASELYLRHTANQAYTPDMMRENILTTALEHGQIGFLLAVVRDLASGHLAACGCTLRSVMDWAWKSVANVKDMIDKLCVPIFDCSCSLLDSLVLSQLNFHMTQIGHLKIIFQKLMEYTEDSSDKSKEELKTKLNVVSLIHQYLKVLQWFINNGLLPEQMDNPETEHETMSSSGILIYKYSRLRQVFDQRREELARSETPDLLLIDGWIEEIGEPLTSRWLKEEGGKTTYPPPSFMTLLDMYYLDCVDVISKHCLVMYLLLDVLAMFSTLEDEGRASQPGSYDTQKDRLNNIGLFLHLFSVPIGLIKLTQAFWLLDHKNFEDALNVLLAAETSPPTASWQERRILKAFLHQGHPSMALKYISTRHPHVETAEDAKMHINIYIKSRELLKAWDMVQAFAGHHDTKELFTHLFVVCQQHSQLEQLLRLPMTATEEDMVVKYLRQCNNSEATQILVLFHLQRSRYIDAIKLHSQNKHTKLMRDQSEESRRRNARLDHIVQSYTNLLPRIEREVLFSSGKLMKHSAAVRRVVQKPSTLSGVLHSRHAIGTSHATILTSQMERMDESRRKALPPPMTPFRKKPQMDFKADQTENTFVYPTISAASRRRYSIDIHGVLGRRSSFGMAAKPPESIESLSSSTRHLPPHMRRNSNISVASMLLQTPPITRRRSSSTRPERDSQLEAMTPHSILKVKQLLKRSRSPSLSVISQTSSRSNSPVVRRTNAGRNNLFFNSEPGEDESNLIRIHDAGLESEDEPDWIKWQRQRNIESKNLIMRLHSTSLGSEGFSQSSPKAEVGNQDNAGKKDTSRVLPQENPAAFGTPKRLRFAGFDSSANDSGMLSPIQQVPGVSSLTPVKVEAEDSRGEDEMDVDVTGGSEHEGESTVKKETHVLKDFDACKDENEQLQKEESGEVKEEEEEDIIPSIEEDAKPDLKEESSWHKEDLEQVVKPDTSEEDEVICLDSSSGESEDVADVTPDLPVEEAAESNEEGEDAPADNFRLVLSCSEGSELEEDAPEMLHEEDTPPDPIRVDEHTAVFDHVVPEMQDAMPSDEPIEPIENIPHLEQEDVVNQEEDKTEGVEEEETGGTQELESEKDNVEVEEDASDKKTLEEDVVELADEGAEHPIDEESLPAQDEEEPSHFKQEEDVTEAVPSVLSSREQDVFVISDDTDEQTTEEEVQEEIPTTQMVDVPVEAAYSPPRKAEDGDMGTLHLSEGEEEFSGDVDTEKPDLEQKVEEDLGSPVLDMIEPITIPATESPTEGKVVEENPPADAELTDKPADHPTPIDVIQEDAMKEAGDGDVIPVTAEPNITDREAADIAAKPDEPAPGDATVLIEKAVPALQTKLMEEGKSLTPVLSRVREEPTFVLSPPTTRRSTRTSARKSKAISTKQTTPIDITFEKTPSHATRQSHLTVPDPEFLFSPPTTRKRSTRRKGGVTSDADQSLVTSPPRSTRRTRGSGKSSELDVDQSSLAISPSRTSPNVSVSRTRGAKKRDSSPEIQAAPSTPSRKRGKKAPETEKKPAPRTPSRRRRTRESSPEEKISPAKGKDTQQESPPASNTLTTSPMEKTADSSPQEKTPAPSTPSRRTRQSPSRKMPATPTRSSSRVRAKKQLIEQQEKASESESQTTDAEPPAPKRTRRKKSSDAGQSESESDAPSKPVRRTTRSRLKTKAWSPSQDITKLIDLATVPEEEVEEEKPKRGKKTSTSKTTRSVNPVKMRRKAKVITLDD